MRGKGGQRGSKVNNFGITPAYAGKSFHVKNNFINVKDHPRLCGEKIQEEVDRQGITGSPPPMRGKAIIMIHVSGDTRITPAYAGKRL